MISKLVPEVYSRKTIECFTPEVNQQNKKLVINNSQSHQDNGKNILDFLQS